MTRFLACGAALLLLLAACTAVPTPDNPPTAADLDAAHGVAVFGVSIVNNPRNGLGVASGIRAYWMRYDPATGRRLGTDIYETNTGSGIFMNTAIDDGGTGYFSLRLPPGDYALAELRFVQSRTDYAGVDYLLVHGELRTVYGVYLNGGKTEQSQTLLPDARLLPLTPHFHVDADAMVYVGNLVFDAGENFKMKWSLAEDDAAARKFVASADPNAAAKMQVQLLTRGDGRPIGHPDEVTPVVALPAAPAR